MNKVIAVHVGPSGDTVSFNQPGRLQLYEKECAAWRKSAEHPFTLNQGNGLREMRKQMAELLEDLKECQVIVAQSITGVPYYELERAGFSLWEFSGKPEEFLDQVLAKEQKDDSAVPCAATSIPTIENLGNGFFRISIKEIQEADAGLTSKQLLMPLLRQNDWYQLEVLCSHIPPWLEAETIMRNITCETKKIRPGEILVTLQKRLCEK